MVRMGVVERHHRGRGMLERCHRGRGWEGKRWPASGRRHGHGFRRRHKDTWRISRTLGHFQLSMALAAAHGVRVAVAVYAVAMGMAVVVTVGDLVVPAGRVVAARPVVSPIVEKAWVSAVKLWVYTRRGARVGFGVGCPVGLDHVWEELGGGDWKEKG